MRQTRAIELGTGLFVLLGFAALFFLVTQITSREFGLGESGYRLTATFDQIGGLKFPGQQSPDYWDFVYFSFVIAMTSQVSDVAITSKVIRRVATVHGVLSFFFNVSVLALTVNMVSNLIKPG